jgi:hypothetical protein
MIKMWINGKEITVTNKDRQDLWKEKKKKSKKVLIIGLLIIFVILGAVFMDLLVRYQPTGQKWQEFELEEGIIITKRRNGIGNLSVALPNIPAVRNAPGYGKLEVLLDDMHLFAGKTSGRTIDKDKVNLTANDYLWEFGRTRRSFYQSTFSKTGSEMFTNLFDKDNTSNYITGEWGNSYTAPWLPDYDAISEVIHSDDVPDYFDAKNKSGLEFMDFLAKGSYKGSTFKYFYWFDVINGTWTLFYQPDGFGKLWDNLVYTVTEKLNEDYEDIVNDVEVWGKKIAGFFPPDQDYWTEKLEVAAWNEQWGAGWTGSPAVWELSSTRATRGEQSLHFDGTAGGAVAGGYAYLDLGFGEQDYVNLETLTLFSMKFYLETWSSGNLTKMFLTDSSGYSVYYNFPITTGSWQSISITGKTVGDGWFYVDPSFDWTKVNRLYVETTAAASQQQEWYLDELYFELNPLKSENSAGDGSDGYDSTSAATYGRRTSAPIHNRRLDTVAKCNTYAKSLVNYTKQIPYTCSIKFDDFYPMRVNDNFKLEHYGGIILPIDQLKWTFNKDGVTTNLTLGTPKLNLNEILNKIEQDVDTSNTDDGQEHFVY